MAGGKKEVPDTEAFTCSHSDGKRVYAQLYLPEQRGKRFPLLILGHGYTSSYSLLTGYAERLSGHQIACCIFDFCGGSNYSRSDGSMLDMSVVTQKEDLKLVLRVLRDHPGVDPQKIYIGGESQGGLVAALAAPEVQAEIAGLVLLYPALYIPEAMRAQFPHRSKIPERIVELGTLVGRRYVDDVYDIQVYPTITRYTGPVLILHGSRDGMVPLPYSQKAAREYQNAKLVVLPRAGHGIYGGHSLHAACREIAAFIYQQDRAG